MDTLSAVLSRLKPQTYVAGGLDMGGEWSVQFNSHCGVKYFALVSGTASIAVEGEADPICLKAGDCVLLPRGKRFVIAKDPAFKPLAFETVAGSEWIGGIARVNGGGDTMMLGGHFALSDAHSDMLLGTMPPVVRLRDESEKAGLHWALDRMRHELSSAQPGSSLVVQHLAHLMLVQALRLYLSLGAASGTGLLFASGDPRIGPAIDAIHRDPGRRWTLPVLAAIAGMSRSKFALRFKAVAGTSPIEYLTSWRMLLASDRLTSGKERISDIAVSLGYESEAAFSTAFKRVTGYSPRKYVGRSVGADHLLLSSTSSPLPARAT
ncbi:AraC family transcriptional regulator [Neorhizobium lilium]|uniref:AraC family transcriptional regulator n=1 Tax=Neorhizobium lilium TaxID=2503024 RepID=A0A444LJF8_9HYPH|nr:AraC family transcriptional regulator [Neorhizobium lilium]RWX79171.1 AraC family transcriptional regulator [Neorhizobium lilium]